MVVLADDDRIQVAIGIDLCPSQEAVIDEAALGIMAEHLADGLLPLPVAARLTDELLAEPVGLKKNSPASCPAYLIGAACCLACRA